MRWAVIAVFCLAPLLAAPGARAETAPLAGAPAPVPATNAAANTPADTPADAATGYRLIMVERVGCIYCARWNAELGPIYPKTPEGRLAPLEHVDLGALPLQGVQSGPKPVFTPTFLLLRDNVEVGRIEGYPGEDMFWGLLGMALREAGADLPPPG